MENINIDSVRAHILHLRNESRDPQFTECLTVLMNDLDTQRATPKWVSDEVARVYQIYLQRMNGAKISPPPPPAPAPPPPPPQDSADGVEYTFGGTIIGIIGAIFLLVGFITFGVTYLQGIFQGIFLYFLSAVLILISECFVKRKLAKFSHALTGLGIAALYASTIINYLYMKIMNSIVAVIFTLLIAGFSIFLSRKKDSAMMRMISFIGCYVCFLLLARFQNQFEFLMATGFLFLVNVSSIFFPNQKYGETIHKVHMGLNTLFVLAFVILSRQGGITDIYIILCLILNIVLLNIVCLKQEKNILTTVLFGIETGIISIMILSVLSDLTHSFQPVSQQIYYLLIVFVLILAISVFFYVLSRDKMGKIYQYYFFIIFSLLLLFDPIDKEYIWGLLFLFVLVKLSSRAKEYEAANAIITIYAFGAGLACKDEWQTWLFLALAIVSIPLIKRWRLFYQYVISIYFILFISLKVPDFDMLFLPLSVLVLFALVPTFRFLVRIRDDEKFQKVYNLTNISVIGLLSFFCLFSEDALAGSLVAMLGAAAIVLYLNPLFFIEFKKKYLLLAGYLTFMTLIVRFPNPIFTSMILMLIAAVCVGIGFKIHDKSQRICGLVLAIFVSLKLTLYDFRELGSLQKTILFMVVGIFALFISLLYIRLEKKKEKSIGGNSYEPLKVSVEKLPDERYNVEQQHNVE